MSAGAARKGFTEKMEFELNVKARKNQRGGNVAGHSTQLCLKKLEEMLL